MKTLIVIFIASLFVLSIFSPAWSGRGGMELKLQGQLFSADLKGVSLKVILEKLEKEKGIWIKCNERLLEEKVSVQFQDLSLRDGLKRILAQIDHSLVFNRAGRLIGLYIVGKGAGSFTTKSDTAMLTDDKHAVVGSSLKADNSFLLVDGPIEISAAELDGLKIIKNCPPPGGPVKASAEELENFKVIKNVPPPGS